jgi:hypothetical protein
MLSGFCGIIENIFIGWERLSEQCLGTMSNSSLSSTRKDLLGVVYSVSPLFLKISLFVFFVIHSSSHLIRKHHICTHFLINYDVDGKIFKENIWMIFSWKFVVKLGSQCFQKFKLMKLGAVVSLYQSEISSYRLCSYACISQLGESWRVLWQWEHWWNFSSLHTYTCIQNGIIWIYTNYACTFFKMI